MGKRSDFERVARDFYPTPLEAVAPLIPHLSDAFKFIEPCAGDGRLVQHVLELTKGQAQCSGAYDISLDPQDRGGNALPFLHPVEQRDALSLTAKDTGGADYIITNPPWSRDKKSGYILHKMISHFSDLCPTWLLFDADWIHTKQATPYIEERLVTVVSVGRVSWEQNGTSGKDNVAWYLFQKNARAVSKRPTFWPRGVSPVSSLVERDLYTV